MTLADQMKIERMYEQIAALRERIAVLEARPPHQDRYLPVWPYRPLFTYYPPPVPSIVPSTNPWPITVTCGDSTQPR